MAFNLNALLLALHLLAAACWFGAGWYDRLIVSPSLKATGPAGIAIIRNQVQSGGGARWFAPASMLTVITGAVLYWRLGISFATVSGVMVSLGALLGVAAVLLGIFVHAPTEKRLKQAAASGSDDEVRAIAHHLERHTTFSAVLVTAAFILMATRYMIT